MKQRLVKARMPRQRMAAGIVLTGALLLVAGLAFAENVGEVINPRTASGSFVTDSAGILGAEYVSLIDSICNALQRASGAEMAVITVSDLGGLEPEDFSEKLFRRFGIGQRGKDNGLLLLFSLNDRAVRMEVGYGLESVIPDARASQILDRAALPHFRNSLYGRGLFLAAKEFAVAATASSGHPLTLSDPAVWPQQVTPPPKSSQPPEKRSPEKNRSAWLIFALALLVFTPLGILLVLWRVGRQRSKAAREKAIHNGLWLIAPIWILALVGFILSLVSGSAFLPTLLGLTGTPTAATLAQTFAAKAMRRRLASYRLPCAGCGQRMSPVSENADDEFLSTEEAAEEKAGGMNYEFWNCDSCGKQEHFAVKLGKADACPKCKRRTLTSSLTTLMAANYDHGGKVRETWKCQNPKCDYERVSERSTAKLTHSSSSSSSSSSFGGSRSSGSSFGGGRSGGGGATKRW